MKNILVITTGGTIVCTKNENGLKPGNNKILEKCFDNKNINVTFLSLFNIDSSNIDIEKMITLGKCVNENYKKYDGIIITHGTDTMAYTSSVLHIMLKNIAIPIVLTGSQLPLENKNSDAINNINLAVNAAISKLKGVFIAFDNKIINGFCVTKTHSTLFSAFESINYPYVNLSDETVVNGDYEFNPSFSDKVFLLKITPLTNAITIDTIMSLGYKGIVIEGYGLGCIPNSFVLPIKNAIKKNVKIWVTSQSLYDGVNYSVYKVGKDILKAGAIDCGKMTTEFAIAKLSNEIK